MRIEAFAPAKINLALHLTGRRDDGYHLLESLVVFADIGDRLWAEPNDRFHLTASGPFGAHVPMAGNLVERALTHDGIALPVAVHLDKNLPVASGIGGGSADAAAALRLRDRLGFPSMPDAAIAALGADVPMCMDRQPALVSGAGEQVTRIAGLAALNLVLVNPGVPVSTADVFSRRAGAFGSGLADLPAAPPVETLAAWLTHQRNDLEPVARLMVPQIDAALAALAAQDGCLLARMSGSGATCFGVFGSKAAASAAAEAILAGHEKWWVRACRSFGSGDA